MSRSSIVSEASTRESSIDLSYSEIDSSQLEMDIVPTSPSQELNPNTAKEPKDEGTLEVAVEQDPIYFCENVVLMVRYFIFCPGSEEVIMVI